MDAAIVGIGLHPFGRFEGRTALDMGAYAARQAMKDAGIEWKDVQLAFGGSGDPSASEPDSLVSHLGLTGLPFVNIRNGCATGGSALAMAVNAIKAGACDLSLVVGFDKHPRGAFAVSPETFGVGEWYGKTGLMLTPQFFAMKIHRYMHEYGISTSTLAKVAAKNFRNGSLNPNAWRQTPLSEEDILCSRVISHPLTQYMFCSPDEGGAALVVSRADQAHRFTSKPIYIRATVTRSRRFGSFEVFSPWLPLERTPSPTVDASKAAYEMAGLGPEDVDVAQVQDSEAGAETYHMAENGLCKDGEQEALIRAGETEIGGRLPINTDGGLIANGEPVGASGLRQVYETILQLRGGAGPRQIPIKPKVGYCQVYGAPGTSAVAIFST